MVKQIKNKTKRLIQPSHGKILIVDVDPEDCDDLFPCAKFIVCIPKSDLDRVVAYDKVFLNYDEPCICCFSRNENTIVTIGGYLIEAPVITYRTIIEGLTFNNFAPTCNHLFLEGLQPKQDGSFDLIMGS